MIIRNIYELFKINKTFKRKYLKERQELIESLPTIQGLTVEQVAEFEQRKKELAKKHGIKRQ